MRFHLILFECNGTGQNLPTSNLYAHVHVTTSNQYGHVHMVRIELNRVPVHRSGRIEKRSQVYPSSERVPESKTIIFYAHFRIHRTGHAGIVLARHVLVRQAPLAALSFNKVAHSKRSMGFLITQ